jgi:hypothetical protein
MTGDWTIIDSSGGEQLKLGDERAVVRARLGDFRVFRRTADAPETDHFVDRGLQVTTTRRSALSSSRSLRRQIPC